MFGDTLNNVRGYIIYGDTIFTVTPVLALQGRRSGKCYRCGGNHLATDCRFRTAECHTCGKKGHLARVCRGKSKASAGKVSAREHHLNEGSPPPPISHSEKEDDTAYMLFNLPGSSKPKPLCVNVKVNQVDLRMEVDTGAVVSVIRKSTYSRLWSEKNLPLQSSSTTLRTYTGERIEVWGAAAVMVEYLGQKEQLELLVVSGSGPSLLGRDWLLKLRLNWQSINQVATTGNTENTRKAPRSL